MTIAGRQLAMPGWAGGRVATRVAQGAAVVGFVLGLWILVGLGIDRNGGSGGGDALAYWRAGRAIVDGTALYGADAGTTSAFLYSPLFAQAVTPFTLLPQVAFVWLWRLLEVGALRVATGSWTRAGIAILVFPPVIIELAYGNVNLVIAAICALVMRGRVASWSLPMAVKAAAIPLAPLALVSRPRTAVRSAAIVLAITAVSVAVAPALWSAYLDFLATAQEPTWWTNLSRGIPLVARFVAAMGLGLLAVRWRRVAPVAVLIGLPIVWLSALSILVATVVPLPAAEDTGQATAATPGHDLAAI